MIPLRIPTSLKNRILEHLSTLYGTEEASEIWKQLSEILSDFQIRNQSRAVAPRAGLCERDSILITYGDQFFEPDVPPLKTLHTILTETLGSPTSGVHILPFFPYSSDDGFSVIDYTQVDPALGAWDDVELLGKDFALMFDAVINHVSRESEWFQRFLAGDPEYLNWFIAFEPGVDTDWVPLVTRPRALPLLSPVRTVNGQRLVWTTFSDDQIDLNYGHAPVLLRVLEVLLRYVEEGAQLIRLDAIAYLWKERGTSCIHLDETHRVVKLMRCVLDAVAPGTILITETNVPHEENISYFGAPLPDGGTDEAQLVYQFPLPPLVMHSLLTGSARALTEWAASLEVPPQATFLNFVASHDGIGIMPVRGLLQEKEVQTLVDRTLAHGGRVSYKTNPDGSQSVYELNISYFDALSDPASSEPLSLQVARFMVSQAIILSLAGIPGIYIHSLLGSRSWQSGVQATGHNRTINREKLAREVLEEELADARSLRSQVFRSYAALLRARASAPAFHPFGGQQVLFLGDGVFALVRSSPDRACKVLCLHNVSDRLQHLTLPPDSLGGSVKAWRDIVDGCAYPVERHEVSIALPPYGIRWLKAVKG